MKRLALVAAAVATAFALPAFAQGVGSLVRITVIDRTANRELPVHWKDGRAWIAGQPGNEYQIRVRNVAGEDLLAVMSVDGVNVITGESAHATQSGYVLGSYASLDVSGWRKNMQRTAAFYFTSLSDSYAARTGRPEDVGVIGVALYKRKPPEPIAYEAPRPMPFAKQDSGAKRAEAGPPLGTGHGRPETNPAQWVDFERATPYPIETIAIRYDSTRNLVAQGVIRAVPRPRDPNPFPGFVPDPVSDFRFWHRAPGA